MPVRVNELESEEILDILRLFCHKIKLLLTSNIMYNCRNTIIPKKIFYMGKNELKGGEIDLGGRLNFGRGNPSAPMVCETLVQLR